MALLAKPFAFSQDELLFLDELLVLPGGRERHDTVDRLHDWYAAA